MSDNTGKTSGERLICVGKVLGAHGVKGMAKIASYTSDPTDIAAYGPVADGTGTIRWTIKLHGQHKGHFLAKLSGVETREQIEALRGTLLYIPRSKLPELTPQTEGEGDESEDQFYYADLIGLQANLEDGTPYGIVRNIINYGASDILEIKREDGARTLVAFTKINVPHIDLPSRTLTLNPPIMDEDEEEDEP